MWWGMGNLGAPPKPPRLSSKSAASSRKASSRVAPFSISRAARPFGPLLSTAVMTSAADRRTSSRRVRQASPIRAASSRRPVRPQRRDLGKYVPAKNGRLSGVITIVSGQPPEPVNIWQTAM